MSQFYLDSITLEEWKRIHKKLDDVHVVRVFPRSGGDFGIAND